jgi:2-polyprenyl-3-methyl-5-hydroxy-6-metoxy-1,4-benzoquinol methylase
MERKILESLDYSHLWVTAKEHILQVYEEACKLKGGMALDVGCFQGHSALAMGLAGMYVDIIDHDSKWLEETTTLLNDHNCVMLYSWCGKSDWALHSILAGETFNLIMHDAGHGQEVVTELLDYWQHVRSGGTFIVHDTDQIDLAKFIAHLGYPENKTTADERGRCLSIFYKP